LDVITYYRCPLAANTICVDSKQHEDVQMLRDEFNTLKDAAHAADPELKHAINHKGRIRSFTDEVGRYQLYQAALTGFVLSSALPRDWFLFTRMDLDPFH